MIRGKAVYLSRVSRKKYTNPLFCLAVAVSVGLSVCLSTCPTRCPSTSNEIVAQPDLAIKKDDLLSRSRSRLAG